jgi:ABC-2 type transport system permease protein
VARALAPAGAARFAAAETGTGFDDALAVARDAVGSFETVEVEVSRFGEALFPEDMGRFDLGAPQQLVLFTFITTLTGSAALILSRKLGITTRMLSTPTPLRTVIVGESLGRATVGMFQGVYIMLASLVLFQVDWGNPLAGILLLAALTAVAAGAAMLMGAFFANEQQAAGIAVMVSLGLGALGGAMLPRELFPPTLKQVSLATPHAWALEGFADLVRDDGGLVDVLPEIGVLAVYAVVLFAIATWRLRRTLTSG